MAEVVAGSKPNITNQQKEPVHVIKGRMPQRAGRVLSAEQLTPWERKQLEEVFGYDGKSDVPTDLATRLEEAGVTGISNTQFLAAVEEAANAAPEGFTPPTQDLDLTKLQVVTDEAAVTAALEKFSHLMAQADAPNSPSFEAVRRAAVNELKDARQHSSLHPDIAQAFDELEREVKADTENRSSVKPAQPAPVSATAPKPAPSAAPEAKPEADPPVAKTPEELEAERAALRAQQLQNLRDQVTQSDIDTYRYAVTTFQRFTKSYEVFDGDVTITFSDHGVDEWEMLVRQEAIDRFNGRVNPADVTELLANTNKYSLAMALRKVEVKSTNKIPVDIPANLCMTEFFRTTLANRDQLQLNDLIANDTDIRVWQKLLAKTIMASTIGHIINTKYNDFRLTMFALRELSKQPEFFKTPTR